MEKIVYDVDYFLNKFQAIEKPCWLTNQLGQRDAHCALGHCGVEANKGTSDFEEYFNTKEEAVALCALFANLKITPSPHLPANLPTYPNYNFNVVFVNDGECKEYQQEHPKDRILAALHDIKKLQEQEEAPQYIDITTRLAEESKEVLEVSDKKNIVLEKVKN